MKDIKKWLPGTLISLTLVAVILYFVDFNEMLSALQKANYALIAVAIALGFVWMFIRAKVWQTLLRDKPAYKDVLFTEGEGYLLNNFLPFRLGELGRAFLISRKPGGVKFAEALPTIVIERVVDLIFSAMIFLFSLPYVVNAESSPVMGYTVGGVMLLGLVMMFVLARNNQWALDAFHKLSARFPSLQKFGGSFLESFFQGLSALNDGWLFTRFLFWMTLNWAVALLAYYLMTLAYFPEATWLWGVFGLGMAAFGGRRRGGPRRTRDAAHRHAGGRAIDGRLGGRTRHAADGQSRRRAVDYGLGDGSRHAAGRNARCGADHRGMGGGRCSGQAERREDREGLS